VPSYYVYVFGENNEELKIGRFNSKDDTIAAVAEFLEFFEKNMDARKIDIVITGREEETG